MQLLLQNCILYLWFELTLREVFFLLEYRYLRFLQCVYILGYSSIQKFLETPIKTIARRQSFWYDDLFFERSEPIMWSILMYFCLKLSKVFIFCPIITLNIPLIAFTALFHPSLCVYIYTKTMFTFAWWILTTEFLHESFWFCFLIILLSWIIQKVITF